MKWLQLFLTITAVAAIGCKKEQDDPAAATPDASVTVGQENIAVARMAELRSGPAISGTLEPKVDARLRAEVSGTVERTLVDEGTRVKRGTLLAELDDRAVRDAYLSAKSAVRTAESALENARRNAERASRLAQAGALPQRDLETAQLNAANAEATLADAKARLASAEKQLRYTQVRSAIDGVVSDREVAPGDVVQVGQEMFRVVDLRTLRLEATVPVEDLGRLRPGSPVEFGVSGFDHQFAGKIERINPAVDPATRQVRIYVNVPNVEEALKAGLFAEGRVATDAKRAVAVPASAIDRRGTSPVIHRIKSGKVDVVPVQLGVRDEALEMVEVAAGVAQGDTVLLGSAQGLTNGTPVRVTQEEVRR